MRNPVTGEPSTSIRNEYIAERTFDTSRSSKMDADELVYACGNILRSSVMALSSRIGRVQNRFSLWCSLARCSL
jgi:hypothetical protein